MTLGVFPVNSSVVVADIKEGREGQSAPLRACGASPGLRSSPPSRCSEPADPTKQQLMIGSDSQPEAIREDPTLYEKGALREEHFPGWRCQQQQAVTRQMGSAVPLGPREGRDSCTPGRRRPCSTGLGQDSPLCYFSTLGTEEPVEFGRAGCFVLKWVDRPTGLERGNGGHQSYGSLAPWLKNPLLLDLPWRVVAAMG